VVNLDGVYHIGEQLFENYGQPNNIYFLYHGFSLVENSHDCVQHDFMLTATERKQLYQQDVNKRILQNLRVSPDTNIFSTCLQLPINTHTWAFLSLKVRVIDLIPLFVGV
jgi:hypothetical protein